MPPKVRTPPKVDRANIQALERLTLLLLAAAAATCTHTDSGAGPRCTAESWHTRWSPMFFFYCWARRRSLILYGADPPNNVGIIQRLSVDARDLIHNSYHRAPLLNRLNFLSLSGMGQKKWLSGMSHHFSSFFLYYTFKIQMVDFSCSWQKKSWFAPLCSTYRP